MRAIITIVMLLAMSSINAAPATEDVLGKAQREAAVAAAAPDWGMLEAQARFDLVQAYEAVGTNKAKGEEIARCAAALESITKARFLSGQADLQDTLRVPLKQLEPQLALMVPVLKAFGVTALSGAAAKGDIPPQLAALLNTALQQRGAEGDPNLAPQIGEFLGFLSFTQVVKSEAYSAGRNAGLAFEAAQAVEGPAGEVALRILLQGGSFIEARKLALEEVDKAVKAAPPAKTSAQR